MNNLFNILTNRLNKKTADLNFIKQKYDWDCGHACLKMLGYNSYNIFPDVDGINTNDLEERIPILKKLVRHDIDDFKYYFKIPTILVLRNSFKDEFSHMILAYKDKIYYPAYKFGVFKSEKYIINSVIHFGYQIPFNSDTVLNN